MGGLATAVTDRTTNVLLEAAWWDPVTIRRTARRLGMHTDASHRFERGTDLDAIPGALSLAARLLVEGGGTAAPGFLDAHGNLFRVRRTALRLSRLRLLSGDGRVNLDVAEQALRRLGFSTERKGKHLSVSIPLFRTDVRREDDLVEEVLRVYGYGPPSLAPAPGLRAGRDPEPLRRSRIACPMWRPPRASTRRSIPVREPRHGRGGLGDWLRLTATPPSSLSPC